TERLYPTSRVVAKATGFHVQRNKAVVGQNAFAHEAGIHQHGLLMHSATYEIMKPQDVGLKSTHLALGKHSGRHLLDRRLQDLGRRPEMNQLDEGFEEVKALADKKRESHDGDLEALISGFLHGRSTAEWELAWLKTPTAAGGAASANLCLQRRSGEKL